MVALGFYIVEYQSEKNEKIRKLISENTRLSNRFLEIPYLDNESELPLNVRALFLHPFSLIDSEQAFVSRLIHELLEVSFLIKANIAKQPP